MRLPPPPGRLIDVGGHRLHIHCAGRGVPVVLESALGASSLTWRQVQASVSAFARACAYDRAGFGWSDAGPLPRTAGQIVSELRALLSGAGVEKPCVLVGHSFGGLTARLYAQRYPEEVSGLVLLDPASPEDWRQPSPERLALIGRGVSLCRYGARAARLRIADAVVLLVRLGALEAARVFSRFVSRGELTRADEGVLVPAGKLPKDILDIAVRTWTQRRFFEALGSQIASVSSSASDVDDDWDFGVMPVVVVSGELNSDACQLGRHAGLAARSHSGRHVIATGSGHWIPLDRPDVVTEAIRYVIDDLKVQGPGSMVRGPVSGIQSRPR
jgi:pimeloyl-ACP methyl ester carboxylesterase